MTPVSLPTSVDACPVRTGSSSTAAKDVSRPDWRLALPRLTGDAVSLRELRLSDAAALLAVLSTEEVTRFILPPPTTVDGFERYIAWTHRERAAGRYVCFGVLAAGLDSPIGLFQVRPLEPGFATADWGFALGSSFWGTGVFLAAARLTIEFAFDVIGVHRLEARAALANGRGNGALAKVGAVKEGLLRRSFLKAGQYHDQAIWSIVREDWRQAKAAWCSNVH